MYKIQTLLIAIVCLFITEPSIGQDFQPYIRSQREENVRISTDIGVCALPITAATLCLVNNDWEGFKQGLIAGGVSVGSTLLLKYSVREPRPDYSNNLSFPSGHSSVAFTSAAFIQRRYGWGAGLPAYMVASYVGWGRIYAKKHNWWDVVAGAALGTAAAYLFTTPFASKHNLSLAPVATDDKWGLSLSMSF